MFLRKAGEACVQLIRIFYFCDDQHDTVVGHRDRFHHDRSILSLETDFVVCALHHLAEQISRIFASIC